MRGSVFALGQPSSNQVNRPQDPIQARSSIALQITSSVPWLLGSVFAPGQPSSNQVNRPQDPIQARLSIALQITSSISWLSSLITRISNKIIKVLRLWTICCHCFSRLKPDRQYSLLIITTLETLLLEGMLIRLITISEIVLQM